MTYQTHRCKASLQAKASIRKYISGSRYDQWRIGKWMIGKAEDSEWGTEYLHTLNVPIWFCPFCGKELE